MSTVCLQGIKAVIAESYERIHRSNLVGMGIVPLQYQAGQTADSLGLTGKETYTIALSEKPKMGELVTVKVSDVQKGFFPVPNYNETGSFDNFKGQKKATASCHTPNRVYTK